MFMFMFYKRVDISMMIMCDASDVKKYDRKT